MSNPGFEAWHRLISEAESTCQVSLHEDLESYLVFLLMRYCTRPELANTYLGLEYLQTAQQNPMNELAWRDVGDKCLLFSGLFPENAQKRRVSVRYFIDLGQSAFDTAANVSRQAELFQSLARHFPLLRDILHATRADSEAGLSQHLSEAVRLWDDAHSDYAESVLLEAGKILPTVSKQSTH